MESLGAAISFNQIPHQWDMHNWRTKANTSSMVVVGALCAAGCSHPSRHLGCVVWQHLLCPQHIFALIVSSWLHSEILLLVYVTGTWQSLWNGQCTVDMYALTARSLEHRSLLSKYKSFHVAGHSIIFIGFGRYFCREKKSKSLQSTGCWTTLFLVY